MWYYALFRRGNFSSSNMWYYPLSRRGNFSSSNVWYYPLLICSILFQEPSGSVSICIGVPQEKFTAICYCSIFFCPTSGSVSKCVGSASCCLLVLVSWSISVYLAPFACNLPLHARRSVTIFETILQWKRPTSTWKIEVCSSSLHWNCFLSAGWLYHF